MYLRTGRHIVFTQFTGASRSADAPRHDRVIELDHRVAERLLIVLIRRYQIDWFDQKL